MRLPTIEEALYRPHASQRGSEKPLAKLHEDFIPEILDLLAHGFYQREVADLYGVHQVTISKVKCGVTWA